MLIPSAHCDALIRAIARDGEAVVSEGTLAYAEAVGRWPMDERRYVLGVVKFYNESHYLDDPGLWEKKPNGQVTKQQERTNRNRETIVAAIRENRSEIARSSGGNARKRID